MRGALRIQQLDFSRRQGNGAVEDLGGSRGMKESREEQSGGMAANY
jgi:hypothetical protein